MQEIQSQDNNQAADSAVKDKNDDGAQRQCLQKARSLWLSPSNKQDLDQVETMLRSLWFEKQQDEETTTTTNPKRAKTQVDPCSVKGQAGARLALWLIQSGRTEQADEILKQLSFQCRLSSRLLNGDNDETNHPIKTTISSTPAPCRVYNYFLSNQDCQQLFSVFGDISSSYWTDHNYSVEPPSPYYSYLVPLKQLDSFGFLGSLITRLQEALVDWQPLLKTCSAVELWAHNRPAATGHQLHFDTDNEGCGDSAVRHPLVTTILYLTDAGGPTLVSNQRKASRHAADKGWTSYAAVGRMAAMDGRVLHCVVPGKATTAQQRRVTLMLAFWRRIKVRDEPTPGAARKFPLDRPWAQALRDPSLQSTAPDSWKLEENRVNSQPLDHVFEDLNGEPWQITSGLPNYDCVFQGI